MKSRAFRCLAAHRAGTAERRMFERDGSAAGLAHGGAGPEQTALFVAYHEHGGHDGSVVLVHFDMEFVPVGTDDVRMYDEGQSAAHGFHFVFKFVFFVYAQPEHTAAVSAAAGDDTADAQIRLVKVLVFGEEGSQLLLRVERKSDFQHDGSPGEILRLGPEARSRKHIGDACRTCTGSQEAEGRHALDKALPRLISPLSCNSKFWGCPCLEP